MLHAALAGAAVRLLLAWSGVGPALAWRIEVSTAANSNLELREGLALFRLGVSPYTGSSCRTPPLALWLYGALADHHLLYVIPNTILDLLAALLLYRLASDLFCQPRAAPGDKQQPSPSSGEPGGRRTRAASYSSLPYALAWAYLLNPFTLAASAAGTTSSLESLAVVAALYGACARRPALAAAGLAVASYMCIHAAVLLLPVACLLSYGPEDAATPLHSLDPRRTEADTDSGGGGGAGGGVSEPSAESEPVHQLVACRDGQEAAEGQKQQQQQGRARASGKAAKCEGEAGQEKRQQSAEAVLTSPSGTAVGSSSRGRRASRSASLRAAEVGMEAVPNSDVGSERGGADARTDAGTDAGTDEGGEVSGAAGPSRPLGPAAAAPRRRRPPPLLPWGQLARCTALTALTLLVLATTSDLFLLSLPPPPGLIELPGVGGSGGGAPCVIGAVKRLAVRPPAGGGAGAAAALAQRLAAAGDALASCWAVRVYGSQVLVDDATPNVGQWWYLSMEVFEDTKVYLRLLVHSLLFALAPPLAMRLGVRRPLALFVVQLLCLGLLKPYPSVADLGLAAPLLLLLTRQQLAAARLRLLLPASLALLCVLGPAMQRMWLSYESANSNFFYSVTLLYGVWQVVLLGQVLGLTLRLDRVVRGKERL